MCLADMVGMIASFIASSISSLFILAGETCQLQCMAVGWSFICSLIILAGETIGRLDDIAIASVHDQVVKSIEGATNLFPPRTGVKMPSSLLRYPLGTQG